MPPREPTLWIKFLNFLGVTHRGFALVLASIAGTLAAAGTWIFRETGSADWPRDAAQLIATLLIAVAIEGRQFGGHLSPYDLKPIHRHLRGRLEAGGTLLFAALVIGAEVVALGFASGGNAFPRVADAFVTGVLVALVATVVVSAVIQPPSRGQR